MNLRFKLAFAALALSTAAYSQILNPATPDAFQVRYAANLNIGDSFINITNNGASGGNICVQVYAFDKGEELLDCCTCTVTPNGLAAISVHNLVSNTLTGQTLSQAVIKLVATNLTGAACDASTVATPFVPEPAGEVVSGMRAWGTTLHAAPTSPVSYSTTETEFSQGFLSVEEYTHITSFCQFIEGDGSGQGVCSGCQSTALGATSAQ
jgi:hypothetical protein